MVIDKKRERNIAAKILALVSAIVLWVYVMNEQNPPIEAAFAVPLEVRSVAVNYVVNDIPESVKVKVRGPRNVIASLQAQDIKSYLDLKGLGEGQHSVKINVVIPPSLELAEITPDKVTVRLEPLVSRVVSVVVKKVGALSAGIILNNLQPDNGQVTVDGPKNLVSAVEKVMAFVNVAGKDSNFSAEERLIPVNQAGNEVEGVNVTPVRTRITAEVSREIIEKTADIKPVAQGEPAAGFSLKSITAEPPKIQLKSTDKELGKLEFVLTEPVNIAGMNKDGEQDVKLQLPEGITSNFTIVRVKFKIAAHGQ